jgi:hypothetical protein
VLESIWPALAEGTIPVKPEPAEGPLVGPWVPPLPPPELGPEGGEPVGPPLDPPAGACGETAFFAVSAVAWMGAVAGDCWTAVCAAFGVSAGAACVGEDPEPPAGGSAFVGLDVAGADELAPPSDDGVDASGAEVGDADACGAEVWGAETFGADTGGAGTVGVESAGVDSVGVDTPGTAANASGAPRPMPAVRTAATKKSFLGMSGRCERGNARKRPQPRAWSLPARSNSLPLPQLRPQTKPQSAWSYPFYGRRHHFFARLFPLFAVNGAVSPPVARSRR